MTVAFMVAAFAVCAALAAWPFIADRAASDQADQTTRDIQDRWGDELAAWEKEDNQ